jgi:hypothetical protein
MTKYEEFTGFIDALTITARQKIERAQAMGRDADRLLLSASEDINTAECMVFQRGRLTIDEASEEV